MLNRYLLEVRLSATVLTLVLIVLIAVIAIVSKGALFEPTQVVTILRAMVVDGMFALGCLVVMISGGFDMSFPAIAAMYRNIAIAEKGHEERYLGLLKNIEEGKVFLKDGKVFWQCRNCGYICEAQDAPKTCPACLFPQAFFEPMKEN